MEQIDRIKKSSGIEPYCFPDLKHSPGDGAKGDLTRSHAFQRQFSGSLNDERRSGQRGEVCPPPWSSVNLSGKDVPEKDLGQEAASNRQIIDRLMQENEQRLKAVYAQGREEGRQEGLEQGRREGYDLGKKDGILQGREQGEERMRPIAAALQEALDQLDALRKAALHEARMECVRLAFSIAERIVGIQVRLYPDTMKHIVEKACDMTAPSRILRVRLHPDAVAYCQEHPSLLSLPEDVVLIPDASLLYGGCSLETDTGEIDARMESQLQVLLEALERELELSRYADSASPLSGVNSEV